MSLRKRKRPEAEKPPLYYILMSLKSGDMPENRIYSWYGGMFPEWNIRDLLDLALDEHLIKKRLCQSAVERVRGLDWLQITPQGLHRLKELSTSSR